MHRVGRWLWAGLIVAMFGAAGVGDAPSAAAQFDSGNYVLQDWWWRSPVIEYRVNLNGAPPGALEAVKRAAATWNAVPGSQAELRYVGTTSVAQTADDGVNAIYWGPLAPSIGRTGTQIRTCSRSCGRLAIDTDILISNTAAITVGSIGTQNYDLESLMLHEFGHALGLQHTDPSQAMYMTLTGGTHVRTLGSGDQAGLRVRFPSPNGDVNCDGTVNIIDALAVAQFSVATREDAGRCPAAGAHSRASLFALMGDANGDDDVNIADAFLVAKCAVGLSTPICTG